MTPIAFLSYVQVVDKHDGGRIGKFGARLELEFLAQTGRKLKVFQDRKDIHWGENWKRVIEKFIDEAAFFIPFITEGYFLSKNCRYELELFLKREEKMARSDLVFPVYYISSETLEEAMRRSGECSACETLEEAKRRSAEPLAEAICKHQYADYRKNRHKELYKKEIRQFITNLALDINKAYLCDCSLNKF